MFGTFAIIGMMYPFVLREGLIFDGRSVVISLVTLFFGPVSGFISAIMAVIYRVWLGGAGALTGVLIISFSAITGFLFYRYLEKKQKDYLSLGGLYLLGIIVHLQMLLLMLSLPWDDIAQTLKIITPTVLGAFPIATLIIGTILLEHRKNKVSLAKLKESEERFRRLSENAMDTIFRFDYVPVRKFTYVSPSVFDLTGHQPEEFYKNPQIIEKIFMPGEYEKYARTLTGDSEFQNVREFRWQKKNGIPIYVEEHKIPIRNDEGEIVAVEGIIRDITQRKETLKIWLENERLSAIGQTSSAIAHDFNNSLQAIFSNVELILFDDTVDEKIKSKLRLVQDISEDAAGRVQTLQRFGADNDITKGFSPVKLVKIVNDVILQTRPLWKYEAEKKGLFIEVECDIDETIMVNVNQAAFRSALYNLMKNAVEAMPDGGNISCSASRDEQWVTILLKDNGKGMSPEIAERSFIPFFTTKGFEVGRGIGLSGVYKVMKDHGGDIKIKSTMPGEGTTFEIKLPVIFGEEGEINLNEANKPEGKLKILWVDDDQNIRDIASEMITTIGMTGQVVESGSEALALLSGSDYDFVITDVGMPNMNGWQLSEKIHEKFNGNIPVAVVTGWGSEITDDKLKEHHASYVLPKPFRVKQLLELVGKVSLEIIQK
ncbi:MAG: hypothetical protein SCALA702_21030 [Melioribacteraceae bacterium]|nr:MAG: hypothetical protein SCALA702_21030 [Melioribacteraceae bacterium]